MKFLIIFIYTLKLHLLKSQMNHYIDKTKEKTEIPLPLNFDARIKWPNCIDTIKNQKSCGACYAISASSSFSMRYCIRNNLTNIINFSSQHLINCLSGCKGEFPDIVWTYFNEKGIPKEECEPYKNKQDKCLRNTCDNNKNNKVKYYKSGKIKFLENEYDIKKEIMLNGPVQSMFIVYKDYFDYKNGIYSHKYGNDIIDYHGVVIIGWGEENGIKYWVIKNSLGENFGDKGYFKMKIGDDSGIGQTAFCDDVYNIDNNNYDNNNGDEDNNVIISNLNENKGNTSRNQSIYLYFRFFWVFIFWLVVQ